jgi:hypothetical protein
MAKKMVFRVVGGVLLVVLLLALAAPVAFKRGISGRLKESSDSIGGQAAAYSLQASNVIVPGKVVRKVIRNANISLKVKDAQKGQSSIVAVAAKFNGIVINSSISRSYEGIRCGSIVFKVLPNDLDNALSEIRKLGDVESEGHTGEDVTEEYIDLQARLQNYKLVKERLTKILDERAREVKDILDIEREMARVGAEIESLEGKIKFIDQQADMATVTVNFSESNRNIFGGINLGERFSDTLHTSVEASVNAFNGIVIVIAFMIPVVFWGCVLWGLWKLIRKIFRK